MCQKYNDRNTGKWSMIAEFPLRRFIWEKEWFANPIEWNFSTTDICVPSDYRRVLNISYGNWEIPQHVDTIHGEMFFDTEHPYTDYLGKYNQYSNSEEFTL
jgi:hypothetical protein